MKAIVARQPIFDPALNTVGYELLFRSGTGNAFPGIDGDVATSSVISNGMFSIGLATLTGGKPAFINFTRNTLLGEVVSLLPPKDLVVEVLETVEPDDAVLAACRALKEQGYRIALDDFVESPKMAPLVELAAIIKVDLLASTPAEVAAMPARYLSRGIALLAEKVETREVFDQTRALGYSYFQGYFFSKPVIVERAVLPESALVRLRLLREMAGTPLNYQRTANVIKHDVSLTCKLLFFVNSAAIGLATKVHSVEQAISLLGERNIRKWVAIVVLAEMNAGKPDELLLKAVLRARFCELLAPRFGLADRAPDLFMLGLFSHLDAIMGQSLPALLKELPLPTDVAEVLLGGDSAVRPLFDTVVAYEAANWTVLTVMEYKTRVKATDTAQAYAAAVEWVQTLVAPLQAS